MSEIKEFKPSRKIMTPMLGAAYYPEDWDIKGLVDYVEQFFVPAGELSYSQEEIEDEFLEAKKKLDVYPTPIEFLLNNSY